MVRILAVGLIGTLLAAGCASSNGDQDRITRIDGPAQVDDDSGPEQVNGGGDGG